MPCWVTKPDDVAKLLSRVLDTSGFSFALDASHGGYRPKHWLLRDRQLQGLRDELYPREAGETG